MWARKEPHGCADQSIYSHARYYSVVGRLASMGVTQRVCPACGFGLKGGRCPRRNRKHRNVDRRRKTHMLSLRGSLLARLLAFFLKENP